MAQDCIVTTADCGTKNGLMIRHVMNGSDIVDPLFERILGRVLAEDLVDMKTGNVLVAAGQMVTEEHASLIEDLVLIRQRSVRLCLVRLKPGFAPIVMVVIWPEAPM